METIYFKTKNLLSNCTITALLCKETSRRHLKQKRSSYVYNVVNSGTPSVARGMLCRSLHVLFNYLLLTEYVSYVQNSHRPKI